MLYRKEIDGLRALAVIPVILFHAGFDKFSGGYVGVDVFLVISGYLITSIIISEKRAGTFKLSRFYERRVRRIFPALYLVIFASIPFAYFLLSPGYLKEFSESLIPVTLFISNIWFWQEIAGYFATATELTPLVHTWSLAVEEQYYLLFPLFILLTWKYGSKSILVIITSILFLSLFISHWGAIYHQTANFFLLPSRAWELLIGVLLAFYLYAKEKNSANNFFHQVASFFGVILILYAVFKFDENTLFPSLYALVPTLGTALIILFASHNTLVGRLLSTKPLVLLGLISYSTYLWHQPIFAFYRHADIYHSNKLPYLFLTLLAIMISYFSWKYVEKPFRNLKVISKKTLITVFSIGSLTLITLGFIGHLTNGLDFRYAEADRNLLHTNSEWGKYVPKKFLELRTADFKELHEKKVLVIGDSYAQDLTNAIYESKLISRIQVSSYSITDDCNNISKLREFHISKMENDWKKYQCELKSNKQKNILSERMKSADSIWLAINWEYDSVSLLPGTIKSIQNITDAKILIFGNKNFGNINIKKLLNTPSELRYTIKNPLDKLHIKLNKYMASILPNNMFIDVSFLLCGKKSFCNIFTNRKLISHDGGHLTKDGAKLLGDRLLTQPLILNLLDH